MNSNIRNFLCLAISILCLGVAGASDYNDELEYQKQYCQMVKDGLWPDYQETYDSECR